MALFSFFRTPKNQRYQYKPRFWDPVKEERKERLEYLESIKDNSPDAVKKRLQGGFKRGYSSDQEVRSQAVARSNRILLLIIVALICLTYVLLTVYLPQIVDYFE